MSEGNRIISPYLKSRQILTKYFSIFSLNENFNFLFDQTKNDRSVHIKTVAECELVSSNLQVIVYGGRGWGGTGGSVTSVRDLN